MSARTSITTLFVLISLLLVVTTVEAEPAQVQEPYRIGAILPLTGPLASLGTGSRKGIEMAVEALNSAGGISGRDLEVLYEDSMGDPKTGLAAFMRIRPALNVPIVISGLTSVSQALKKVADREKILVFAESSLDGMLYDSELMMRNFTDSKTFYGGMRRDLLSRGIRKIAVLRAQEEWAQGAFNALTSSADLQVVEDIAISADTSDIKPLIGKLRAKEGAFDALVLVLLGSVQGMAINQLHQFPIDVPLFTAYLCSQPTLREVVKHRFNEGVTFEGDRDSEDEVYQRFLSKFRARYGQSEPEFSVLSQYDTVMFVAEALRAGMQTAVEIKRFITNKREFKGLLGATIFDSKGDAVHAAIPMRYKDGVCREAGVRH